MSAELSTISVTALSKLYVSPPSPPVGAHHNLSYVFKKLVRDFEQNPPHDINVMKTSKKYQIQHRRVYDFFNFLTYFNICKSVERKKLSWNGLDKFVTNIALFYSEVEVMSLTMPLSEIFNLGPSPSLGAIANRLVCLFLFMDTDILVFKKAALLFNGFSPDVKSLERRMYLVISFLEIIGVVEKSSKKSEFTLLLDRQPIISEAMKSRAAAQQPSPFSVESILSKYSKAYYNELFSGRRKEFSTITNL